MKYQVVASFFNVDARGNHKPVAVGSLISAKVYQTLAPQKQAKCVPMPRKVSKKMHWSVAEHEFAIHTYLEIVTAEGSIPREELRTRFAKFSPEREYQGVSHTLHQIRTRDSYTPQGGFDTIPLQLLALMHEIAPERFTITEDELAQIEKQRNAICA